MASVVCSTSICTRPGLSSAPPTLSGWEELCGGLADALAVDARNNPDEQKMLLASCEERGIPCAELAHPRVAAKGRPVPSPASADPEERLAARAALIGTLHLAAEYGVRRVVHFPVLLRLGGDWQQVVRDYALGVCPKEALAALDEERADRAPRLLDAFCLTLEPCLQLARDLELELVLPLPAPLPQQAPAGEEVAQLIEVFTGAPLGVCLCADWIHVLGELRGSAETDPCLPASVPPHLLRAVRVADACGLTPMLPPGTGEIDWPGPLYDVEGAREVDQVLAVGPGASRAELEASRELLTRILSGDREAPGR